MQLYLHNMIPISFAKKDHNSILKRNCDINETITVCGLTITRLWRQALLTLIFSPIFLAGLHFPILAPAGIHLIPKKGMTS